MPLARIIVPTNLWPVGERMTHLDLMHGMDYAGQNVAGWLVQEKFDGLRALWTGRELMSREGKRFNAPAWFLDGLPDSPLDGELYGGPGTLSALSTRLARWKSGRDADWHGVRFMAFDAPDAKAGFTTRTAIVRKRAQAARHAVAVAAWQVGTLPSLADALRGILAANGEGMVLRHPDVPYVAGRTEKLLKLRCPSRLPRLPCACPWRGSLRAGAF
jgi:DNA ligase-1